MFSSSRQSAAVEMHRGYLNPHKFSPPAPVAMKGVLSDVCSFAVQPKTLPSKASGATSNPEFPSLRFYHSLFLTLGRRR
jgi:hypothetical protein